MAMLCVVDTSFGLLSFILRSPLRQWLMVLDIYHQKCTPSLVHAPILGDRVLGVSVPFLLHNATPPNIVLTLPDRYVLP